MQGAFEKSAKRQILKTGSRFETKKTRLATQICASAASSTGVFAPSHNPEVPATLSEESAPCPSNNRTI